MKLALQPVRRNLRAKSAPANLSTCGQFAFIDSAIVNFRTLSKNCRVASARLSKFFRYRSSDAKRHANKPFRMNTCESVSKQRTLTAFRINTYEKHGGRGLTGIYPTSSRPERHDRSFRIRSYEKHPGVGSVPSAWPDLVGGASAAPDFVRPLFSYSYE